ncbi:hypothetical protein SORBI_3004G305800 [Sorghum bicolor]|uniref:Cyanobacterial aminoacyl-tRNA synthetase CAAD domain-containing protein n=1 Tax=Sorghum bicolor TaxID=4558 RepID=A0A194YSD1_SORBI|nr:hypothetical protein SORBI_3004G305800 [Sorghum bicolor]
MPGPGTGEKRKRKHHLSSNHPKACEEESARPQKAQAQAAGSRRMSRKLPSGRRSSRTQDCRRVGALVVHTSCSTAPGPGSHQPSITLASSSIPPRGSQKPQNPTRPASTERGEQREWEIMELCVSTTTASVRATTAAPISFAPPRRGGASASTALPVHHRRIPTRGTPWPHPSRSVSDTLSFVLLALMCFASGWRCAASAAVPDPVPSEEPASASYTVVVTDKPDTPADDKVEEVSAAPSGSAEAPVAELVSSEASPSPDGGGLDEILSKLNIEVTPTLILTGSAAFVALWILSSVVAAIDSVPLLPKLLELVGTGYSIWFIARYLLFKESRDDLFAKFEDLIQRIV